MKILTKVKAFANSIVRYCEKQATMLRARARGIVASTMVHAPSQASLSRVSLGAAVLVGILSLTGVAHADDVDFTTVVSTILGYLGAAFTAAATLLALIYGAPLAWRFIKKFK